MAILTVPCHCPDQIDVSMYPGVAWGTDHSREPYETQFVGPEDQLRIMFDDHWKPSLTDDEANQWFEDAIER